MSCGGWHVLTISEPREGAWYSVLHGELLVEFAAALSPPLSGATLCAAADGAAAVCTRLGGEAGERVEGEMDALGAGQHALSVSVTAPDAGAGAVPLCVARVEFTVVELDTDVRSARAAAWLQPVPSPALDFEPVQGGFGRAGDPGREPGNGRRSLVATFVGGAARERVARALASFPPERFSLMVFVYDDSEWGGEPWAHRATIVHVRGQMKWWYVKRFLHPELVAGYEYLLLLDDDVALAPSFDADGFVGVLREHAVGLGQPAHAPGSATSAQYVHALAQRPGVLGLWTNFVEIGACDVCLR